jgi:hypothetical protein
LFTVFALGSSSPGFRIAAIYGGPPVILPTVGVQ